ncbi:class I SAM-dependent methyltransferase [Nonomuraea sp. NPDC002799]
MPPDIAQQVAELFGGMVPDSLYGPDGACLYDLMFRYDRTFIAEMLAAAQDVTGPILELGCGAGRVTVPFLEHGHEMVALDRSPHMLTVLMERLLEQYDQSYFARILLVAGDMADFRLGRRFGLVLITDSAALALDEARRAAMFQRVREHLAPEGRLLIHIRLTELDTVEDRGRSVCESVSVFTLHDGQSPLLCTLFDRDDPVEGVRSASLLTHRLGPGGVIADTKLLKASIHPVSPAMLTAELERAGLRVTGRSEGGPDPLEDDPPRRPVRQVLLQAEHGSRL